MTRVFRRGELEQAVLHVVVEAGPASGYAIMQTLADRVGGSWRPSPGSVYPALIALEDRGLIVGRDDDGARSYEATADGRARRADSPDLLEVVARRASDVDPLVTVGSLLDDFASAHPDRRQRLDPTTQERIAGILDDTARRITTTLDRSN